MSERILTTHVGSLPRPQPVVELLSRKEAGDPPDAAEFDAVMRDATTAIVARQRAAGVDVVSDGEQSKASYATYIKDRLTGFSGESPPLRGADLDAVPSYSKRMAARRGVTVRLSRPCCTGPIGVRDRAPLLADLDRFRAALDTAGASDAFMNAASPGVIAAFQQNRWYPDDDAYLAALTDAMRDEYRSIVAAGFMLQIDCPDLAMGRHLVHKDLDDDAFVRIAEQRMDALNAALAGLPPERLRLHLCWGNYEGPHHFDIPLARIFHVLMRARAGTLLFEAANPRHAHEWQVFAERRREIPDDKVLVPGVVTSTSNYVEHPLLVAERLLRFADIVGRDRVMAGSDCGFSTFAGEGPVDGEICWLKLQSMAEGARIASARLWPGG